MFNERFQIFLADTNKSRRLHYRLRCEIYCVDRSFENLDDFPTREEMDDADRRSIHFLVAEKSSKEWIGVMRVVLPDNELLPIERHCVLDTNLIASLPRHNTAELSRLGIARRFTQRTATNENNLEQTRYVVKNLKEITYGLWRALIQLSLEKEINDYLFIITPALARVFLSLHAPIVRAGVPCEYRGTRYPYLLNMKHNNLRIHQLPDEVISFMSQRPAYIPYSTKQDLYNRAFDLA